MGHFSDRFFQKYDPQFPCRLPGDAIASSRPRALARGSPQDRPELFEIETEHVERTQPPNRIQTHATMQATHTTLRPATVARRLVVPRTSQARAVASVVARAAATEDEYALKYPAWESISPELTGKYNIQVVGVDQAKDLVAAGSAVLVDVRPAGQYEEAHPAGAINIPAFRVIDGGKNGVQSFMRFAVMKLNGVVPTESNPDYVELLNRAARENPGKTFMFICKEGGTLTPSTTFPAGKVSRSLKAIWRACHNGAELEPKSMVHVEGGIRDWAQQGLDMEEME